MPPISKLDAHPRNHEATEDVHNSCLDDGAPLTIDGDVHVEGLTTSGLAYDSIATCIALTREVGEMLQKIPYVKAATGILLRIMEIKDVSLRNRDLDPGLLKKKYVIIASRLEQRPLPKSDRSCGLTIVCIATGSPQGHTSQPARGGEFDGRHKEVPYVRYLSEG